GYVEVNKQVARKVVEVARGLPGRPLVMVHDYQLYLVPKLVREQLQGAIIQHFVHIPWPTPQYWKVLPREMRDAILHGLLGCDIVEERKLRDWRPEHLIVRIDRTDPSKNIVRGFLAYEKLLAHHPELRGRVQFWAFLQPSRQDVAIYRNYVRKVRQTVQRINAQYGAHGWQPIRLELGESVRNAMAAMRNFDVLVVNSVSDVLNLVAKEAALINRSDRGMV